MTTNKQTVSRAALASFNDRKEVSFNDAWNAQHKVGTIAERGIVQRVANDKYGICRDPGRDFVSMVDVTRYFSTLVNTDHSV